MRDLIKKLSKKIYTVEERVWSSVELSVQLSSDAVIKELPKKLWLEEIVEFISWYERKIKIIFNIKKVVDNTYERCYHKYNKEKGEH